jgi:hypothetical protein
MAEAILTLSQCLDHANAGRISPATTSGPPRTRSLEGIDIDATALAAAAPVAGYPLEKFLGLVAHALEPRS